MLVPNQMIRTKWMKQNKEHYESLGYNFTKFNKFFFAKPEHLPSESHIKVKVVCDKCGKEKDMQWRDYLRYHSEEFGDLCMDCCQEKRKDTCIKKYGTDNPSKVEIFKEKRTSTMLERFGVENVFQSKECKEKIKQTNLENYGVEFISQSEQVKEKTRNTNLERYGFTSPAKSELVKNKTKQTCLERYGYEYTLSVPEIRERGRKTLYEQGNVPTSKPERKICEMLEKMYGKESCTPGYPYQLLNFDCLLELEGSKIDVEYDGWYWHKDKQDYDRRRNYMLTSRGFKVLRIKGSYALPTEEQLKEAVDYLVKGNHPYTEIVLDI